MGCHFHVKTLEIARDRFTKVLAKDTDHGADEEEESASFVVELEDPVVDVRLVKFEVLDDVAQDVRHRDDDDVDHLKFTSRSNFLLKELF